MSAVGFATSVYNKLTKKVYDSGVTDQMIKSAPFIHKVYKRNLELGSDANFSIKTAWGEGIGARGDREQLPIPQAPNFLLPTFDASDQYLVLRITGKEDIRTKNGLRATAEYLKNLLKESSENFWRDMEFQAFNDGTGVRAIINGSGNPIQPGAGTVFSVNANSSNYSFTPLRGIRTNMTVEFWNEAVPVKLGEAVVTAVNRLAGTFTCDTDFVVTDQANVYVSGNRQREINGLQALINDSTGPATVLGVSRTTPEWQSTVLANSGNTRNLTIELLDQGHFSSKQQNDKDPTLVLLDYTQIRKWTAMVNRNFEINGNGPSVKVNAHNEIEEFGEAKIMTTSQMLSNAIFLMQAEDFELRELVPFGPVYEEDADNIWHKIQGYHEFEATFWWSGQLICKRPNLHVQIKDLATT